MNSTTVILLIKAKITSPFERKYIWNDLHFIVDEKVKILHFRDNPNQRYFLIDDVFQFDIYTEDLFWSEKLLKFNFNH